MKIMKILKKAGGILLVIIGILFFVSALKMIFVDNPKTKAALKDAVYVDAADTIDRKTMERQSLYAAHSS